MTTEIYGKYEVVEKIGEGGFGKVYKGRDPDLKRFAAIKTCTSDDKHLRDRFFREAEIAASLQHPNITTIYDFDYQAGTPYLVQEYLAGEDLDHKIRRRDAIDIRTKLGILLQVATGLAYAHNQGVIHRDVKPANVRVLDDGHVKIMDFGIAKLLTAEHQLTQTGMAMGTAGYLPPEQIRGETIDSRADIFSFGVLAYELMTYRRPFEGNDLSSILYRITHEEPVPIAELWPECPPRLAAIVARCLEKQPADRFATFAEVIAEISALTLAPRPLTGEQSGASPATERYDAGRHADGAPAAALAAAASGAAAAGKTVAAPSGERLPPAGRGGASPAAGGPAPAPRSFLGRTYETVMRLPGRWAVWAALAAVVVVAAVALWPRGGGGGTGEDVNVAQTAVADEHAVDAADAGGETSTRSAGDVAETEPPAAADGSGTDVAARPAASSTTATAQPPPGDEARPTPQAPPARPPGSEPPPAPASLPPTPPSLAGIPPANPRYLVLLDGDEAGVSAAETALVGALLAAGAPVVDPGRAAEIRRSEADMAVARGGDAVRIAAIGRQAGADVVVAGRVTSEAQPGVGKFSTGRATADLRTYDATTGRYLGAKTVRVGGGGEPGKLEPSEATARSAAAEEVGRRGAAAVMEQVAAAVGGPREVRAEVYGVGSLADADQVRGAVGTLAGVRAVHQRAFEATARLELGIDFDGPAEALRGRLDGLAVGGRRLRVTGAENQRLTLELK